MAMNIQIPLMLKKGGLMRTPDWITSIDSHIELMLTTPEGACVSDPEFGFIFNNLRFEIFDENEGVVLNSDMERSELYEKKISGSSRNVNTFAVELKRQIEKYEKRLSEVSVTMSYIREHRKIYITVRGVITETKSDYQYQTELRVWN